MAFLFLIIDILVVDRLVVERDILVCYVVFYRHFCATNVALLQYGAEKRHNPSQDFSILHLIDGI